MTAVFHAKSYGRGKRLYRRNQGSNLLGGSFSNRDNTNVPIQFRREMKSQLLKWWFFIQDPSFSTSATPQLLERLKETNRLFPALLTYWQQATFCPIPQCFVGQKLTLAVVTN